MAPKPLPILRPASTRHRTATEKCGALNVEISKVPQSVIPKTLTVSSAVADVAGHSKRKKPADINSDAESDIHEIVEPPKKQKKAVNSAYLDDSYLWITYINEISSSKRGN